MIRRGCDALILGECKSHRSATTCIFLITSLALSTPLTAKASGPVCHSHARQRALAMPRSDDSRIGRRFGSARARSIQAQRREGLSSVTWVMALSSWVRSMTSQRMAWASSARVVAAHHRSLGSRTIVRPDLPESTLSVAYSSELYA